MQKLPSMEQFGRLADLAYEAAMLKHIPRSGLPFLGSGKENVAAHSFGVAMLGYILAQVANADAGKTVMLCLWHDLPEAATGDLNYVNHRYDTCNAGQALADSLAGTGLEEAADSLWQEFEQGQTLEAKLAADADQLDLICLLRRELESGNQFAAKWLESAVQRIHTDAGKKLCEALMNTSPHHWWYDQVDIDWWINRGK